jgi:diguanylate cyclase
MAEGAAMNRMFKPEVAAALRPHTVPDSSGDPAASEAPPASSADRIVAEWQAILATTPASVRLAVAEGVRGSVGALVERYAAFLQRDPDGASFIAVPGARTQFDLRMRAWLEQLLVDQDRSVAQLVARQRAAGESLARMGFPIHLTARGMRRLKAWILNQLAGCGLNERELLQAAAYVSNLFDMALELRADGFLQDTLQQSRVNEAYRLHALSQNMAMERERQRAALMERGHAVLVEFHRSASGGLPRLGQADFGLWLRHRAAAVFEGQPEMHRVDELVGRIDTVLLPALEAAVRGDPAHWASTGALVANLQAELAAVKFITTEMFDRHIEVENGRDPLTRLLSRRFLPTILSREIALHRRTGQGSFSVVLIDLDHFKEINDQHGHDAGDLVLQHAAALIAASVRPSDFVFRYGGEEFVVVLVESDRDVGEGVARKLCQKLADSHVVLAGGQRVQVTGSFGVTTYNGLADYQLLLKTADRALYEAKRGGRNRVVCG